MTTAIKTKPKKKKENRQGNNFFKGVNTKFNAAKLAKDMLAKREKEDLSFPSIQDKTGIPISVLFRAESGENISLNVLASICNWMGVPVQTYFEK